MPAKSEKPVPYPTLPQKVEVKNMSKSTAKEVMVNKCQHCRYTCDTYKELLQHITSHKDRECNQSIHGAAKINKCHQCGYTNPNYKDLILHIVSHKGRKSEVAKEHEINDKKKSKSKDASPTSEQQSYTFSEDNMYVCNFCGYECDLQRTIKAHMWKHSGHKNLEYPTFQNGPLSVYDGTILSAKNFMSMDRASLRAMFKSQSANFNKDVDKKIHTESKGNPEDKSYNHDVNETSNVELGDGGKPEDFPRVIVQRIDSSDAMTNVPSSSCASTNTSVEHSTTIAGAKITIADANAASEATNPDSTTTATGLEKTEDNPLQVMTAVCAALNKQAVESNTPVAVSEKLNQTWSDTEDRKSVV